MSWHEGLLKGFDTETTAPDPLNARIVTAAVVDVNPGTRPFPVEWVIDPGVEIPGEAAAVHGWTRDKVVEFVGGEGRARRTHGGKAFTMSAEGAIYEIANLLAHSMGNSIPIVVHNAAYDLTLLEAECTRYGIDTLAARPSGVVGVVDPMVIERQWDPYRSTCGKAPGCNTETKHHECNGCQGKAGRGRAKFDCLAERGAGCGSTDKTLSSLYRHYFGRELAGAAHSAADDALAGVRLAQRLGKLWPAAGRYKLPTLHGHEATWRRAQCDGLREWFDKNGIEHDGVDGSWPVNAAAYDVERLAQAVA